MRVMSLKSLLALAVVTVTPSIAHAGSGGHYSVELNKTEVVYLPANAGAVVIGNPEIADVSVHSANTIFVVGRGYGETNLIVLDAAGHKIMDADIQVVNNLPASGVRIYNGKSARPIAVRLIVSPPLSWAITEASWRQIKEPAQLLAIMLLLEFLPNPLHQDQQEVRTKPLA